MHKNARYDVIINRVEPRIISILNELIHINQHDLYDRKLYDWHQIITDGNAVFICTENTNRIIGTATTYRVNNSVAAICDLAIDPSCEDEYGVNQHIMHAIHRYYDPTIMISVPRYGRCTYENFSNIAHIRDLLCSIDQYTLSDQLHNSMINLITDSVYDPTHIRIVIHMIEVAVTDSIVAARIEKMRRFIYGLMEDRMHTQLCHA